jgi:hypothetical protein
MTYTISLGEPEILKLWNDLLERKALGKLTPDEDEFFRKWIKTNQLLANNPRHPGLATHEISDLTKKYKFKVFEAYLENRTPGARRLFWAYGPAKEEITILGVERHPNTSKRRAYTQIKLTSLEKIKK